MESSDSEEDYGLRRPSLIRQLRSVLDQYPDDGQILKELIQNAEDAGATEVKFLYDEKSFPTDRLHHPEMARFQGPALYSYNNATFSQEDWKGIRMLQASVKEKDPMKVGRFGLGFKSVLHITDLPSVLSRDRLFIIDPHERFFLYKNTTRTSGYAWHLEKKARLAKCPDQFTPYMGVFGSSQKVFDDGYYDGTLFRFPLRRAQTELSDTIYSPDRVDALFRSFQKDAHLSLLFLKNLEKIEIYHRTQGSEEPVLLFRVIIAEDCLKTVREERQKFRKMCQGPTKATGVTTTYRLDIETLEFDSRRVECRTSYSWLVTEHLAGNQVSTELRELRADKKLSLIPLVGVAVNLTQDGTTEPDGQVFCFLPLCTEQTSPTGLPVHVNGYFAVDQNRRNLKWPADVQTMTTDKAVKWNQRLIEEVIPVAYRHLLQQAIRFCQPSEVYNTMPDPRLVIARWEPVIQTLYATILNEEIIFVRAKGNYHWKKTLHANVRSERIILTRTRGGHWKKIEDVVVDRSAEDDEPFQTVHEVLLECDCNISRVPAHVLEAVSRYSCKKTHDLTPAIARTALRKHTETYSGLPRNDQIKLLSFALKDQKYSEMIGLHLLARADGEMVEFATHGSTVYTPTPETPRKLFPGLEKQLLADDLDSTTRGHLEHMARQGITCLRELTHEAARRLLQTILPQQWRNNLMGAVSASESPVPAEWFQLLWTYLGKVHRSDLSDFSKLHIVPLQDKFTDKLVTVSSQIVFKKVQDTEMPQQLENILETAGVFLVDGLPREVRDHPLAVGSVVKVPSDTNLVRLLCECLSSKGLQKVSQFTRNLSKPQKKTVVELLSRMPPSKLQTHESDVLRNLPLFPSALPSNNKQKFISLAEAEAGAELKDLPCSISVSLVDISERAVFDAANLLGLRQVTKKEVLQYALHDARNGLLDSATIQRVAKRVFELIHEYQSDAGFMSLLAEIPFVACGRSCKKPCDLFDPSDQDMVTLYSNKDVFPTGAYALEDRLKYLRLLGLKSSSSFSASDALEAMKELQRGSASKANTAICVKKAKTLISMLSGRPALLAVTVKGVPLKEHTEKYAWIPILRDKPDGYPSSLSWKGHSKGSLVTPGEVASPEWSSLVGSACKLATVDVSRIATDVGFRDVTLSLVLDHLNNIVRMYKSDHKAEYLGMLNKIYSHLADHPRVDLAKCLEKKNMDLWIWHGDGFTTVDSVYADQLPLNLHPFVHKLPTEMRIFESFFSACGMQQSCDHIGLTKILIQIQAAKRNASLDDQCLRQCVDILNLLKTKLELFSDEEAQDILVPTYGPASREISLAPARDCCYAGEEGHQDLDTLELAAKGIYLLHQDVPMDTARKLNIPSVMSKLLPAEDISIEGFGQSEPLTTRLKNLLDDYTDGLAIFKEMIQNADDAGATEVGFLYDERTNDEFRTRLLDPAMSDCQGPALWVYNNETFTDQDFENITRLGGGMKQNELGKIGKFGLGFNVVYNLTDVPSLVTKNYLAVFDPHTTYLGNVLKRQSKPGIKLDLAQRSSIMETISDQLEPYQGIYGCHLGQGASFQGTLFRLPLRTRAQAVHSKIRDQSYSRADMRNLFDLLVENAHCLLLFTQNVTSVTFRHLRANAEIKDAEVVFQLTKEKITDIALASHLGQPVGITGTTSQYLVASKNPTLEGKTLICSGQIETSVTVYENATFGHKAPQNAKKCNWLIAGATSVPTKVGNETKRVCHGNVAVKLQEVDDGLELRSLEASSLVFCFLPLPIKSNLNVHINGTFAITSSRQHLALQTMDTTDTSKAAWNEALMSGVICQSYRQCFHDCKEILPDDAPLYEIWPHPDPMPIVQPLVESFFKDPENLPFFIRHGEIVNLGQVMFFDDANVPPDITLHITDTLRKGLNVEHVMRPPSRVIQSLLNAGKQDLVHRQLYTVQRFYVEIYFPNVQAIDSEARNRLLIYAIHLNVPEIDHLLMSTNCIPTSAHENDIKQMNQLIDPKCDVAQLFRKEDGRFPAVVITKEVAIERLHHLGLKQQLSWFELVDRTQNIHIEYNRSVKSGRRRKEQLCRILDRKLQDDCSEGASDWARQVKSVKFLEAKKSKKGWPFPYTGDNVGPRSLFCPDELYDQEAENLVSTTAFVVETIPTRIREFLNFKTTVTAVQLRQQTENIIKFSKTCNIDRTARVLRDVMHSVYTEMDRLRQHDQLTSSDFADVPCVLMDTGFVLTSMVTFQRNADLIPYLYSLPSDIRNRFPELMELLGVTDQFGIEALVRVTHTMARKYPTTPLSGSDMEVAVKLCDLIGQKIEAKSDQLENVKTKIGKIFVPNSKKILCSSDEVCFDDCPWIKKTGMQFLHKSISFGSAEQLKIKPIKQERVQQHRRGIKFGQKEKLTTCLKRILGNCAKADVLKELIQNADDAGATEIHFIRDSRDHPTKFLFGDSMTPLQGPSLCVYNNRPFTERDLEGIQKLGEGSKEDDPCATGQYGVGFCSVYHLTDAPSVMTTTAESGRTLCVFDPHCTYVPDATHAEPGMRYNMDELTEFKDVISGYQQDQCDMNEGSMFRFPLRSESMANQSGISSEPVTMEDVHEMLENLKREACEILLFVNNLEQIKISDVDSGTGKLVKTYTAQVKMSETDRAAREQVRMHMKACSSQMTKDDRSLADVPHGSFVYNMTTIDKGKKTINWCVSQQFGLKNHHKIPDDVERAFQSRQLSLVPRGGVAYCTDRLADRRQGTEPSRVFCFLPLEREHSDLPVHVNGHFALKHENRKQLWVSEAQDYRSSWNELLFSTVIAESYCNLLSYVKERVTEKCESECSSMSHPRKNDTLTRFGEIFPALPGQRHVHQIWRKQLVRGVYSNLAETRISVVPSVTTREDQQRLTWLSLVGDDDQEVFFDNLRVRKQNTSMRPTRQQMEDVHIGNTMKDCGMAVAEVSREVAKSIESCEVGASFITPENVLRVLNSDDGRSSFGQLPKELHRTPLRNVERLINLLEFAAEDENFFDNLHGLPLLLTANGELRCFDSTDRMFVEDKYLLFPEQRRYFLSNRLWRNIFLPHKDALYESCNPVFKKLDIRSTAGLVKNEFPDMESTDVIEWQLRPPQRTAPCSMPSMEWLQRFWLFVHDELSQDKDEYKCLLLPFSGLCVIPAVVGSNFYLCPLQTRDKIAHLPPNRLEANRVPDLVVRWLLSLNVMQLHQMEKLKNADTDINRIPQRLVTEISSAVNVLNVAWHYRDQAATACGMDRLRVLSVLNYFQKYHITTENKHTVLSWFPLCETFSGTFVSLKDYGAKYIIPSCIPPNGLDFFERPSEGMVFLKDNGLSKLYSSLGCVSLSEVDVYCDFIFQHLEYFDEHDKDVHLSHVYQTFIDTLTARSQDDCKKIVQKLSRLRVFKNKSNQLCFASDLHDPDIDLFRTFLPPEALPKLVRRGLLKPSETRGMLVAAGMITELTCDHILKFAREIAQDGRRSNNLRNTKKNSTMLVKALFEKDKNWPTVVSALKDTPFLVKCQPKGELADLLPYHGDVSSRMMAYTDSVPEKWELLVWSEKNLLDESYCPRRRNDFHRILGTHDQPPIKAVLNHVRKLSDSINSSSKADRQVKSEWIQRIYLTIYQYLKDQNLSRDQFQNFPIVLTQGSKLVEASRVVLNLSKDEIRPYLYKLPLQFGNHAELFKRLGAADAPTTDHYLKVLCQVHRETNRQQLLPNELHVVYHCVQGFFSCLEDKSTPVDLSGDQELYLPDESASLHASTSLVVNDAPGHYSRLDQYTLPFLVDVRECGVRIQFIQDVFEILPRQFHPKRLSEMVDERLPEAVKQDARRCEVSCEIESRLRDDSFRRGLRRLFTHDARQKDKTLRDEAALIERLSTTRVRSVRDVRTVLFINNKPIPGSDKERSCCLQKDRGRPQSDAHEWTIYIKRDEAIDRLEVCIGEVLNEILDGRLGGPAMYLLPILRCPIGDISGTLDELNVGLDHTQTTSRVSLRIVLGSPVPDKYEQNLTPGGDDYDIGEVVAYSRGLGARRVYAQITAESAQGAYTIKTADGETETVDVKEYLAKFTR